MDGQAETTRVALVLAGGMGLGAYQGGAYERFLNERALEIDWLGASSVGAVNASLIAGNPPELRLDRLREFWAEPNAWQPRAIWPPPNLQYSQKWISAIQTRLFGAIGHFRPRGVGVPFEDFQSLYDLAPMRRSLERLVDFGRLNSGDPRVTVAATDIQTGETVLMDSFHQQLTINHLMASCGMLPEFAPVQIDGRLLGDGGLSANAPVETILADSESRLVFVLDLFARDGVHPRSLMAAIERKNDLMFGNQTFRLLEFWRDAVSRDENTSRVIYLSHRGATDEAGSEKLFDLSAPTVAERWQAGFLDMGTAVTKAFSATQERLTVIRRPSGRS